MQKHIRVVESYVPDILSRFINFLVSTGCPATLRSQQDLRKSLRLFWCCQYSPEQSVSSMTLQCFQTSVL